MNENMFVGVGRVATTPSLKIYKNQKGEEIAKVFFRLAITRESDLGKKDARTDFVPVVAWGEPAKRHAQYLAVGTEVTVRGELRVDSERDENGKFTREFINIHANKVQYGRKSAKNQAAAPAPAAGIQAQLAALSTAPAAPIQGNPFIQG